MPEYLNSIPRVSKRVCAGAGKPASSQRIIIVAFWKRDLVLESSENLLPVKSSKNMKCMAGSKEN